MEISTAFRTISCLFVNSKQPYSTSFIAPDFSYLSVEKEKEKSREIGHKRLDDGRRNDLLEMK